MYHNDGYRQKLQCIGYNAVLISYFRTFQIAPLALPISIDTKQVKHQKYREKRYLIKSFTVTSKIYNKVSMQQYYIPIPHENCYTFWLALPPQMMTLKRPSISFLLQIPSIWQLREGIIHSFPLPLVPQNKPRGSTHLLPPSRLNSRTSPSTQQERHFKVYLLQRSRLQLGKSKRAL